jgi:chromosome partitioning protein
VANQKGGVGKSTTAVSLGAALAELGYRVLVVDLDPQGNASTGLGIRHEARDVTVYDVLALEAPIEEAIVETALPNLFAIPSTIDLAGAEIELVSQFSREMRLRKALEPVKQEGFDFVFLDCPPSLGLLTVNALAAAEELIVPIQCEYYALEGLGQLLRNVKLVQQNVNTGLRLTGIVMTMFDPRTKLSEQVVGEVRRFFGERVYQTIIPRTVRLSEAPGFGKPITSYDPASKGAQCYRDLAREVAERLPDESPLPVMDDLPEVVVSPPEPHPARAPRPLVREEDQMDETSVLEVLEEHPPVEEITVPEVQGTPTVEGTSGEEVAPDDGAVTMPTITVEPEQTLAEVLPAAEAATSSAAPVPVRELVGGAEAETVLEVETFVPAGSGSGSSPLERESRPGVESEPGEVIVLDEQADADEAPPQPEPEPEPERKGFRGLFRRGGDR